MFPNPDFEPYDNAGRTIEQINAAHTGAPTPDDLRRASVKGPVPAPAGPAISAWTDRLYDAEHGEVPQLILLAASDLDGVLPRLHEFLEAAAEKLQWAGAGQAAANLSGIVSRLGELDQDLYYVAVDAWEDITTEARRANAATGTSPAAVTRPAPTSPDPDHRSVAPPVPPRPDHPRSR